MDPSEMVLEFGMWEPDKLHCVSHMIKETWSFLHFNLFSPTAFFFLCETTCPFFFLLENPVKPNRNSVLSTLPKKSFIMLWREARGACS